METKIIKGEIEIDPGPLTNENGLRGWHAPVLSVFGMSSANGDPTISDDGLGDGLFS
jgi:hypothetical protein